MGTDIAAEEEEKKKSSSCRVVEVTLPMPLIEMTNDES